MGETSQSQSWIQTYTGKVFYPLTPRIKSIDIIDIAHSLSLICRYVGHIKHFYSVAQHSVIVADYFKDDPILAKWGLLHDGPEAYIVDIPRPIKKKLVGYCAIEDRYNKMFAARFDLPYPIPEEVMKIDTRILMTERKTRMIYNPIIVDELKNIEPLDVDIPVMMPQEAELQFLQKYIELFGV